MINGKNYTRNEDGVVAIFSVLIIMGILSVLTLGFATMVRQSQNRTLNEHLSLQAYYAAETGVNLASDYLNPTQTEIDTCGGLNTSNPGALTIDADNNIEITCLLIDPTPPDLEFEDVQTIGNGEPAVGILETTDPTINIETIEFEWDAVDRSIGVPNRPNTPFLPSGNSPGQWRNNVGILRVDLIQSGNSVTDQIDQLSRMYTVYLYPARNSAAPVTAVIAPGLANQGAVLESRCENSASPAQVDSYRCRMNLTVNSSNVYRVRMTPYYTAADIRVTPRGSGGSQLDLKHGQANVDSTGKAGDVYRRIRVRVPLSQNEGLHEPFAIFGGQNICKKYVTLPGEYNTDPSASPYCVP